MLITASILAGMLCMVLHELPKMVLYRCLSKDDMVEQDKAKGHGIVNPFHFIDPIGLLFCVIFKVGFSKPCYYRMKNKKTNQLLGWMGISSLLIQFMGSTAILKYIFGMDSTLKIPYDCSMGYELAMYFLSSYAIISLGMLLTNLFPILTNDLAWLLTIGNPVKFITLLRNDYIVKMVWLFVTIIGVLPNISIAIFRFIMG